MSDYRPSEDLYWSDDPADVAELRERCRSSLRRFGGAWGAGLYPLMGARVLATCVGEPGRLVQVFADVVRVVICEATPHARVLSIPPSEVLLPWHELHRPLFERATRAFPGRRRSSTDASAGSKPSPGAALARPTAARMEVLGGPMLSPVSTALF